MSEEEERVAARTPADFADRVADAYWMRVSVTGLGLGQEKVTRASLRSAVRECLDYFTEADPHAVRDLSGSLDRYEEARERAGVDRALLEEPSLLLPGALGPVQGFAEAVLGLLPALVGVLTGGLPLWVSRTHARAHARDVGGVGRVDWTRVRGVAVLAFVGYWGALVGLVSSQFSDQATLLLAGALVPSGLFALTYATRLRSIVAHVGTRGATWFGLGTVAEVRERQSELVGALDGLRNRYRQEVMGWAPLPRGSTRRTTRAALGRIAFLSSAVGAVVLFGLSFGDQPVQGLPLGPSPWQEGRRADPVTAEHALRRDAEGVLLAAKQLDRMQAEMEVLYGEFVGGERNLLTQDDHDAMRRVLVSYLDLRSTLLKTVWLYRGENAAGPADAVDPLEAQAFLTAYAAAALLVEKAWVIYDTFEDDPTTRDQLDRADAAWGIPAGTWTMLSESLSNASVMAELDAGVRRFDSDGAAGRLPRGTPWDDVADRARASRPAIDAVMDGIGRRRLDRTFASMAEQLRAPRAELTPLVSMAVSRFRFKERPPFQGLISPAQVDGLRDELRPGDILIERRNWYISNSLLPGFWPHAALYLGTPEDLAALGVDHDPRAAPHMADFDGADDLGRRFAVIEAIGEGVIFTSLEQSVGEADAVAVLRPNLTNDELREALARALSHRGKEYDFDFDFQTTDRLVCTELIFRTYDGILDLPPMRPIMGQPRLAAVDYVGLWASERGASQPQLTLVRFLDFDEPNQRAVQSDAETLVSTLTRSRFTFVR
ncbi:MAG: YiiX/YebB-like N1pC/P60 family cysteine hydrolase [Gemmatimonadota bacterium]